MTEVLFYHLQGRTLEQTLPPLLEKCVERGWKTVVEFGSPERCDAVDTYLWTYREENFLPHGTANDGHAAFQPVWLTTGGDNPNGATVRFFADGAEPDHVEDYERVVLIFDGADPEAVEKARGAWKTLSGAGHAATYWQQDENGRWQKKA